MKKIQIILLFFIASGIAFGQVESQAESKFTVEIWGELEPNLLQVITPIGDSANLYNTNGVPYFGTSRIDLFTGGVFRTYNQEASRWTNPTTGGYMDVNKLFMRLSYQSTHFNGRLRTNGNRLQAWGLGLLSPSTVDDDKDTSINFTVKDFLDIFADQYRVEGNFGSITALFGNEDIASVLGKVAALNNHTAALFAKVDTMGPNVPTRIHSFANANPVGNINANNFYQVPGQNGGVGFANIDARHPRRTVRYNQGTFGQGEAEDPYFMLTYNLNKFDFVIGTHLQGTDPRVDIEYLWPWERFSRKDLTGYLRVSGDKVFDLLTFDLVYRIQGGNRNLDDFDPSAVYPNYQSPPPPENDDDEQLHFQTKKNDGEGSIGHVIALFFQPNLINKLSGLNVVAGFSLSFQTLEKVDANYNGTGFFRALAPNINDPYDTFRFYYDNTKEIIRSAPIFYGIDIRANYSGIENFIFNTQNNISFASIKGSNTEVIYGLRPSSAYVVNANFTNPFLKQDEYDDWFYVYNTLGVRYNLSTEVSFFAGVASRFGALTEVRDKGEDLETLWFTNHWISAELMAMYSMGTGWDLMAGITCMQQFSTFENISTGATASSGRFTVAIPILLRWALRK